MRFMNMAEIVLDKAAGSLDGISDLELCELWRLLHNLPGAMKAFVVVENELIARATGQKGGPGSGNWGHTSVTRTGQVGGSDPGGGGSVADKSSGS
jgi:hypothetical protein